MRSSTGQVFSPFCAFSPTASRWPRDSSSFGSASPELLRQSSESLAGRLETIPIAGLSLTEVGVKFLKRHWQRGGFPLSFLARNNEDSISRRRQFIQTFLKRDVPQLGIQIPEPALLRFWTMVAHSHGRIGNSADPARSLGIGESTERQDVATPLRRLRLAEALRQTT
jgi:predicted AAA+ superfamily ATPase